MVKTCDDLRITYTDPMFSALDPQKWGMWSVPFQDKCFADQICKEVVEKHMIPKSSYTNADYGECFFYLTYDDLTAQEQIIQYMILQGLIPETVYGRLDNIPFQSVNAIGSTSDILFLDHFINLYSGEFII